MRARRWKRNAMKLYVTWREHWENLYRSISNRQAPGINENYSHCLGKPLQKYF